MKKGFTFLETLVVISIFSLVFPLVMSILFLVLRQQLRVFSLSEVKRQGDYIVNFMETTIANNAYKIYDTDGNEICNADSVSGIPYPHEGVPATFHDRYNSEFSLDYSEPDLSVAYPPTSDPAPPFTFQPGALNNTKVRVSQFEISCKREGPFAAPLVRIFFSVCYNTGSSCDSIEPQKIVSLDYQSTIKLRSFPTE